MSCPRCSSAASLARFAAAALTASVPNAATRSDTATTAAPTGVAARSIDAARIAFRPSTIAPAAAVKTIAAAAKAFTSVGIAVSARVSAWMPPVTTGTKSVANDAAKPLATFLSVVSESLKSCAACVASRLNTSPIARARCSICWKPPLARSLSSGIRSAPARPKSSSATAVFPGPSPNCANASAILSSAWSAESPRRSRAERPIALSAFVGPGAPCCTSVSARESRTRPVWSPSVDTSAVDAATLSTESASVDAPVLSDSFPISSAAVTVSRANASTVPAARSPVSARSPCSMREKPPTADALLSASCFVPWAVFACWASTSFRPFSSARSSWPTPSSSAAARTTTVGGVTGGSAGGWERRASASQR
jgi:hypothetical protein